MDLCIGTEEILKYLMMIFFANCIYDTNLSTKKVSTDTNAFEMACNVKRFDHVAMIDAPLSGKENGFKDVVKTR